MATKRNVPTQTERLFWREAYLAALAALITRHDGSAHPATVALDAAEHADLAVEKLRERVTWGRQ